MDNIRQISQLWSSSRVAEAFGVGVSSIKRWTDEGILESVKTVGGHRRYRLDALHRFAKERNLPPDALPPLDAIINPEWADSEELIETLLGELGEARTDVASRTIAGYLSRGSRSTEFLDLVVGGLLGRVGELWAQGKWTVEMEHRATYCVTEAIDRSRRPDPQLGPIVALSCPPGERHSAPLNMLRFVLSANGFRSDFLGADLPWESLEKAVIRQSPRLVLLSSRTEVPFNSPEFSRVVDVCRREGATVCVGGSWTIGWTARPRFVEPFGTLAEFELFLHSVTSEVERNSS